MSSRAFLILVLGGVALAGACNAITGVDDYQFAGGTGGASSHASSSSGLASSSTTSTSSSSTSTTSSSTSSGGGSGGASSSATSSSSSSGGCGPVGKDCGGCVQQSDPAYGCGPTGCSPCMVPNATAGCANAACSVGKCDPGFKDCNSQASDGCESQSAVDPDHCGNCMTKCNGDQWCSQSACACRPGLKLVMGKCVDPGTDPTYCGQTGMMCGAYCDQGQCTATCSAINCSGVCTDTDIDPLHCGNCMTKCSADQVCVNGTCKGWRFDPACTQCPCAACNGNESCCIYGGKPACVTSPFCGG